MKSGLCEGSKVIITLPPRHGRSEFTSVYFPARFFSRNPQEFIIGISPLTLVGGNSWCSMDDNPGRMTLFRFDFDYLKNRYEFELTRKEQLTAQLTLPVAVLGLLGSAIVAMARSFSYKTPVLAIPFVATVGAAGLAFLVCLAYLGRSYHRQTYVFLPTLKDTDQSREEFLDFAKVMAGGEAEVLEEFEKQMRGRIINAADRNTETNDIRSGLLHRARLALFAVLLLSTVAGLPYVIDQVRLFMPRPTETNPAPAPTPASSAPQLPTVPPNREIREGDIPTRR